MATEETIWNFAARRERELKHRIAMLEAEIAKCEYELDDLHRAIEAVKDKTRMAITRDMVSSKDEQTDAKYDFLEPQDSKVLAPVSATGGLAGVGSRFAAGNFMSAPTLQFEHMTIKELIVKALRDHFKQGAGAADLVEFIKNAYERAVERSSLSPQLSRMKQDGWIEQQADGTWNLSNEKRMALVLFDHPTSQKSMTESLRKE